jgi:hypothetical protein
VFCLTAAPSILEKLDNDIFHVLQLIFKKRNGEFKFHVFGSGVFAALCKCEMSGSTKCRALT